VLFRFQSLLWCSALIALIALAGRMKQARRLIDAV